MAETERWTLAQYHAYLAQYHAYLARGDPAPVVRDLPLDEPEGAFMERIRRLAVNELGLLFYHPYSSKKSTPGWPDCAIIAPEGGVLRLWELKSAAGQVSPTQQRWLAALARVTQVDARVLSPQDWPHIQQTLTRKTR